jgi:hypothetical protein
MLPMEHDVRSAHEAIRAELKRLEAAIGHEFRVSPEFLASCLLSADQAKLKLSGLCDLIGAYPRMAGIIPPGHPSCVQSVKNGTSKEQKEVDAVIRIALERKKHPELVQAATNWLASQADEEVDEKRLKVSFLLPGTIRRLIKEMAEITGLSPAGIVEMVIAESALETRSRQSGGRQLRGGRPCKVPTA